MRQPSERSGFCSLSSPPGAIRHGRTASLLRRKPKPSSHVGGLAGSSVRRRIFKGDFGRGPAGKGVSSSRQFAMIENSDPPDSFLLTTPVASHATSRPYEAAHAATERRSTNMKMLLIGLVIFAATTAAMAQTQTSTGSGVVVAGGYGGMGYGEVGTPLSSMFKGLGKAIQAEGEWNKNTSEADINWQEAQRMAMENSTRAVETWFRLKQLNHDLRFPASARMTADEYVRVSKAMGPRPLSPGEFDRISGQIYWPELLQTRYFEPQRIEVQNLINRWVTTGKFGDGGYVEVRRAIEIMLDELRDHVRLVPTDQYVDSRRFLEGLAYEAKTPVRPHARTPLISSLPPAPSAPTTR
jgi:hypothetical protein